MLMNQIQIQIEQMRAQGRRPTEIVLGKQEWKEAKNYIKMNTYTKHVPSATGPQIAGLNVILVESDRHMEIR